MFARLALAYRLRLGLTQEDLAERVGVGVRSIRNIETGRVPVPRPATVRALADALGLVGADLDEFLTAALAAKTAATVRGSGPMRAPTAPATDEPTSPTADPFADLDRALDGWASSGDPLVILLCGPAGTGKTALATRWAVRVAHRFPDGQLRVDLRGSARDGPPADVFPIMLSGLGVTGPDLPETEAARSGLYRSLLARRRVLVVLDDAADADQVRPLLPGSASCLTVVTSRTFLAGLVAAGARVIPVGS